MQEVLLLLGKSAYCKNIKVALEIGTMACGRDMAENAGMACDKGKKQEG